jgi:hypothetical protein
VNLMHAYERRFASSYFRVLRISRNTANGLTGCSAGEGGLNLFSRSSDAALKGAATNSDERENSDWL